MWFSRFSQSNPMHPQRTQPTNYCTVHVHRNDMLTYLTFRTAFYTETERVPSLKNSETSVEKLYIHICFKMNFK